MKEHFMKTEVDWEEEIKTHCIFVEQSSGDLCQKKKASESLTIEETHSMTLDSLAILLLSIKLKK